MHLANVDLPNGDQQTASYMNRAINHQATAPYIVLPNVLCRERIVKQAGTHLIMSSMRQKNAHCAWSLHWQTIGNPLSMLYEVVTDQEYAELQQRCLIAMDVHKHT